MTIHNQTAEFQPEIIGRLDASSGRLASAIFKVNGWPPLNATNADLRSRTLSTSSVVEKRRAEDDVFGVRIEEVRDDGVAAIANGQCFDLGKTANTADLLHRQPDPTLLPMLVVPYETTPISIVFGSEPWLFILKGDACCRLVDVLVIMLAEDERLLRPYIAVKRRKPALSQKTTELQAMAVELFARHFLPLVAPGEWRENGRLCVRFRIGDSRLDCPEKMHVFRLEGTTGLSGRVMRSS